VITSFLSPNRNYTIKILSALLQHDKMKGLQTLILLLAAHIFWLPCVEAREYSALVVEPESGRVLYEKYADELRHPASVTKMMTLYLVFEALERGDLTLNTPLDVSRTAVLRPPSRLGLTPGETIGVEDAILGLVTRSANDVATVIAENLGGTESSFSAMMTAKARSLGMRDTVFRNASGLPDADQVTTAWDMYRLGKALIEDFPRYYPYFSTPRFYYRGQSFDNHNHLMETYPGMDGIKTGFINSSGFNLVASASRGGRRIIGVVFGGPSAVRRDDHMREILDDGFAQLNGAPPGYIEAGFDHPSEPRGQGRLFSGLDDELPQVTFGSAKRFKSGVSPSGAPYPRSVYNPPRNSRSSVSMSQSSETRARNSKPDSSRLASKPPTLATQRAATKVPSSISAPKPPKVPINGSSASDRARSKTPNLVRATPQKSRTGSMPGTATCKGAKDKNGRCPAK
jgi:D-alanyl-D-alanine carboxypeptidase